MKKIAPPAFRTMDLRRAAARLTASFTEGWYVKGDRPSQDRGRLVLCNYTSNVIANLIGGSFWTGLLLLLNADDAFIGTMTMIATAANMFQLFSPLILERFPRRKKMLTIMRGALYLVNVVFIGLIPLFSLPQQGKLVLVALSVLVVNLINAFIAPGLSVWHIQSIPNRIRPYYFTIITMTVGAVVAICNLLGSRMVDAFKSVGMEYQGLFTLRMIALALCAVEMVLYWHIKEYPYETNSGSFSVKELVREPLHEKLYLKTVLVAFLWNFSANTPGSYYTVYMLKNMQASYSYLMLISCINVPVVLLLTPIWRKVLQRFNWFKTLYVAMGAYVAHYVLLAMVTEQTMFVYPLSQILGFVTAIGINLSFTGIPYVNMPKKNQTVFMGFYSTVANLAALLGVTVGKYFILGTEGRKISLFGIEMVNKQYLVLLTAVLMVGAVFGIWWIDRTTAKGNED